jgi:hypothetical protein
VTSKQLTEGDVSQGMQGKVRKILTMDLENPSNRYLREPLAALGLIPAMELDSYLALIELAKAGMAPCSCPPACWRWWVSRGHRHAPCRDWAARSTWSIGQTASSAIALPAWCRRCKPISGN